MDIHKDDDCIYGYHNNYDSHYIHDNHDSTHDGGGACGSGDGTRGGGVGV